MRKDKEMTDEYKPEEINQSRGPVLAFRGRLIASEERETKGRDPMTVLTEIFETEGGAYVAVSSMAPIEREGFEDVRAAVIAPGPDEVARRCAVMDFFNWDHHARKMCVKKLKWRFRVEVA